MKKLGIIGGLGPMASAYYLEKITEMTEADLDQEHIEILMHSCPAVPDRTSFILGESKDSPLPMLTEIGQGLIRGGADIIAIPCVTAQYFEKELTETLSVPVINAIDETTEYLLNRGIDKVGLMATDGTIKCGLFQKRLNDSNIQCFLPDDERQKTVMDIIYKQVKAGKDINYNQFQDVVDFLKDKGASVIILGCTELSIAKRNHAMPQGILDVIDVMSRTAVLKCGKLKSEYEEIITK